jgi:hypothetical protein
MTALWLSRRGVSVYARCLARKLTGDLKQTNMMSAAQIESATVSPRFADLAELVADFVTTTNPERQNALAVAMRTAINALADQFDVSGAYHGTIWNSMQRTIHYLRQKTGSMELCRPKYIKP